MKRLTLLFIALFIVIPFFSITNAVYGNDLTVENNQETVKLTKEQQKELAALHKDILETRKKIILKHLDFGLITKEKSEAIISRLEKRYEILEKNNFLPGWHYARHKVKHH